MCVKKKAAPGRGLFSFMANSELFFSDQTDVISHLYRIKTELESMKNLKDNVVVVTGAASGIGRELAIHLAAQGCHLALSDVNMDELEVTASLIQNKEIKVKLNRLNVSDQQAFFDYAEEVIAHFGRVDRVINNAGRSVADGFVHGTVEDFRMVMDVNFWGAYYGTKAFLPHLLTRPEGTIACVSSVNAFLPFPNQSSYNVSKYAISGLCESLNQELRKTKVNAMCIYPGGVKTNIVKNCKYIEPAKGHMSQEDSVKLFEKVAMTSAPRAAKRIISGIRRNKKRLRIGPDAYLFDWLKRIAPRLSVWFIAKVAS